MDSGSTSRFSRPGSVPRAGRSDIGRMFGTTAAARDTELLARADPDGPIGRPPCGTPRRCSTRNSAGVTRLGGRRSLAVVVLLAACGRLLRRPVQREVLRGRGRPPGRAQPRSSARAVADVLLRALPIFRDARRRRPRRHPRRLADRRRPGSRHCESALDDAGVDPATYDREEPPEGAQPGRGGRGSTPRPRELPTPDSEAGLQRPSSSRRATCARPRCGAMTGAAKPGPVHGSTRRT